jgi:hypothetical protein
MVISIGSVILSHLHYILCTLNLVDQYPMYIQIYLILLDSCYTKSPGKCYFASKQLFSTDQVFFPPVHHTTTFRMEFLRSPKNKALL